MTMALARNALAAATRLRAAPAPAVRALSSMPLMRSPFPAVHPALLSMMQPTPAVVGESVELAAPLMASGSNE